MKKSNIYLLSLVLFLSFTACDDVAESPNKRNGDIDIPTVEVEKAKVAEQLDILVQAVESGNMVLIEKIWCPKKETMLIGTENDEKLVGWTQIKQAIGQQSDEFSDLLISITEQNIRLDADGRTAWFFEELNYNFIYKDKALSYEGIRFTGVFVKSPEGAWRLVQGHMSVPSNLEVEE